METQDGGDAKVEVSPRDIIYSEPAEPLQGEKPSIMHKLDLRYGYALKNSLSLSTIYVCVCVCVDVCVCMCEFMHTHYCVFY